MTSFVKQQVRKASVPCHDGMARKSITSYLLWGGRYYRLIGLTT